jgi:hypothetical protein
MRYSLLCLILILFLGAFAIAQNDGDAVLAMWSARTTYLVGVTAGGVVTTITSWPNTVLPDGLVASPANDGALLVARTLVPFSVHLLKFQNPAGVSTLATLSTTFPSTPSILVDAGGDLLILNETGHDRGVYRMPGQGGPTTTVAHNSLNANFTTAFAMTEEPVSGDLVVLDVNRSLHRIDRTGKITTIRFTLPPTGVLPPMNSSVHADFRTGLLYFTYSTYFFGGLDPNTGAMTTILQPMSVFQSRYYGLDNNPFGNGYYMTVLAISPLASGSHLMRYDPQNATLSTVSASLPTGNLGDVLTWRSRILGGMNRPARGMAYRVRMFVPSEAGRAYLAGAALGFIPGIPLGGGRWVPLNADPLFYLSMLTPSLFAGFQGTLSGLGAAILTVNIPQVPHLHGFRFFLAAVTYDARGARVISEPLGVTIE